MNWKKFLHCYELGSTTDSPTRESKKGTENPEGIWCWRPERFDYRIITKLGKQTFGGHKQNFVHTRGQEKGAVSPQKTQPNLPVSVQEFLMEAWVTVWPQPNKREGTQPHPSTENWIKDLLSVALTMRTRPCFPHSHCLPTGNFQKPLIIQRADRIKITITENEPNWSHGPQPCLTQCKYKPCLEGPSKTNRSWWRTWSTVEENDKPLQYACTENPMNSMRIQKDMTLKDELPRSVASQYVTGDQWRNNSRNNEEIEPKWKQHPVVDVTGDGSKVWCCKEQYCIWTWNIRFMNQGKLEVVKQEMTRMNIDILGISELRWIGMGEAETLLCQQRSV